MLQSFNNGVSIGGPVVGGTAKRVLIVGPDGTLYQDTGLQFDPDTDYFSVDGSITASAGSSVPITFAVVGGFSGIWVGIPVLSLSHGNYFALQIGAGQIAVNSASYTALRIGNENRAVITSGMVIGRDVNGSELDGTTSLLAKSVYPSYKPLVVEGANSQTADLLSLKTDPSTPCGGFKAGGGWQPAHMSDAAAPNDTVYYSTTASKLVYKDGSGVVNNLY